MAKQKEPKRVDARMLRPVWADPRLMLAQCHMETTRVVVSDNAAHVVIPADPSRFMLGITLPTTLTVGLGFAPYPQVGTAAFFLAASNTTRWFTIFDFGPVPMQPWYCVNGDTQVFLFHSVLVD